MITQGKDLLDLLVSLSYISEKTPELERIAAKNDSSLFNYLISQNILTKDLVGQAIAEHFKIPYADLNSVKPTQEQIKKIPERTAKALRVVLFKEDPKKAVITTDNPSKKNIKNTLKNVFKNKKIELSYSLPADIDRSLLAYRKSLVDRFKHVLARSEMVASHLLDEIFQDAIIYHASDIHFEPHETELLVRLRIDGVMHEAGRLPKEHYESIINRIKVQAGLRIDQHFSAQDGALQYVSGSFSVDMRISIVPTLEGEKIVIRLLSEYVESFSFQDLGLTDSDAELLKEAGKKPFGMILVCGPTGSGKTTTLYALIKMLNQPTVNITTIEDPVEYRIEGINQIQVNQATDLTFADGLRSIVRQDPDIILVGEIRDKETSEIAVNAALTGHLLFSTFHANDAATSIPRLLDMGIEPFLLSSTLELIISQRLVRRLCDQCRYSHKPSKAEWEKFGSGASKYFNKEEVIYQGKGCSSCNNSGYSGRIAIFEFIPITPDMEDLILTQPSTKEIWEIARKHGSRSLFEDGVVKVKAGVTSLEELLRIAAPPHVEKKSKK